MMKTHNVQIDNEHRCNICEITYKKKKLLIKHQKAKHNKTEITKAVQSSAQPKNTSECLIYEKIESEDEDTGAKYLGGFLFSFPQNERKKHISFAQLFLLILYIFWVKGVYFSIFEW